MTDNIETDPETGQRFYTDPVTGGRKEVKLAQLGALDPKALLLLAEHAGKGAEKYSKHNYLLGYDWSLSFDAAQRHLLAFWNGEDVDEESGSLHVTAAAWHCLALASYVTRELGTDTRFKGENSDADMPFPAGTRVVDAENGWSGTVALVEDSMIHVDLDTGPRGTGLHGAFTYPNPPSSGRLKRINW